MIFPVVIIGCIAFVTGQEYLYSNRRNGCCGYASRMMSVGQDKFGNNVNVDVGRCSTFCSFDSGDVYQSVLERIMEKKIKKKLSFIHSQCSSVRSRVDNILLADGARQIDIIESCAFRNPVKSCSRVATFKKFFANTKFETVVDVGECQGGCRNLKYQKTCKSTEISVISIQGPDGVLFVNTIAKCKCEQSCYRQRYNIEVKESIMSPQGVKTIENKIIDIGKCVGSCLPMKKCVMKAQDMSSTSQTNCLMALETNDVKCSPTKTRTVPYVNEDGEVSHVRQVKKCGCV